MGLPVPQKNKIQFSPKIKTVSRPRNRPADCFMFIQKGVVEFIARIEPIERKIRKSGTGCVYQINENLWEGSFFPRLPNGTRKKFNIYGKPEKSAKNFLVK